MEKKLKVLIADNSSEFSIECTKVLKSYGMEVMMTQKDGLRLLSDIKNLKPTVVIADVFMPHLDLLGVLDKLNTSDFETKPLIMALSSFDNQRLEQETLEKGASYYFLRPFDVDMLAERIVRLTGWRNDNLPLKP